MAIKTVLFIDKDHQFTKEGSEFFNQSENLSVIGVARKGDEGLDLAKKTAVDIVVMDLLLDNIDGLSLITELKNLASSPIIIICSNLSNDAFVKQALSLGANYYFVKPVNFIEINKKISTILSNENTQSKSYVVRKFTTREIEEKLSNIFMTAGIPVHVKGFRFLKEAVKQSVAEPSMINNITKALYPAVASKYESTPSKVERAIRHAIGVAWSKGKIENINKIFGVNLFSQDDKPTNGELIALVADKIMIESS